MPSTSPPGRACAGRPSAASSRCRPSSPPAWWRTRPRRCARRRTRLRYAPWLVANVHVRAPLADRPGAAPSWDNVVYGTRGLGYVDARHQALDPTPGATVLSWYRPLGPSAYDGPDGRRLLLDRPWSGWRDELLGRTVGAASRSCRASPPASRSPATATPWRSPGRACCASLGARDARRRRPPGLCAQRLVGLFDLRGGLHARASGGWRESARAVRLRSAAIAFDGDSADWRKMRRQRSELHVHGNPLRSPCQAAVPRWSTRRVTRPSPCAARWRARSNTGPPSAARSSRPASPRRTARR